MAKPTTTSTNMAKPTTTTTNMAKPTTTTTNMAKPTTITTNMAKIPYENQRQVILEGNILIRVMNVRRKCLAYILPYTR